MKVTLNERLVQYMNEKSLKDIIVDVMLCNT